MSTLTSLTFQTHIKKNSKKEAHKLNALSRIIPSMDFPEKKKTNYCFLMSQFNFCQLVWMCYNLAMNNQINRLHKRPANIYLFKVNNKNTRKMCEIYRRSDVFIVNFGHISQLFLVFLLLTLNK